MKSQPVWQNRGHDQLGARTSFTLRHLHRGSRPCHHHLPYLQVNQSLNRGRCQKKKREYMGKIPKGGEGSDPNPLHIFLCFFPIQGLIKWQKNGKKMWTFPNWGEGGTWGGGPPLGNFSHIIPFFSDNVPNSKESWRYRLDSAAVSIFVAILVELTNSICQFNQYVYKYWDGSAV